MQNSDDDDYDNKTHCAENDNTVTAEISVLSNKGLRWIRPIFTYAESVYPAVFY
jgi:hypothetical protein